MNIMFKWEIITVTIVVIDGEVWPNLYIIALFSNKICAFVEICLDGAFLREETSQPASIFKTNKF